MRDARLVIIAAAAILLGIACGQDSGTTPDGAGAGDGRARDGAFDGARRDGLKLKVDSPGQLPDYGPKLDTLPPDGGAVECEGVGNKIHLTMVIPQIELTSTDLQVVSGAKGVIGFKGTATDGRGFWLGREGAPDDGAFTAAGVVPATKAPYHLQLQLWPAGSGTTCAGNAKCETYYALNGMWKIVTVKAPTSGTFIVSSITKKAGCWVEQPSGPPVVTGCPLVGGTLYGCFKAN